MAPRPRAMRARAYMPSFVSVLPRTVVQSEDLRVWTPVADVSCTNDNTARVPVKGTGRPLYVATQVPYHIHLYDDLIRFVREREPNALHVVGKSLGGRPIPGGPKTLF